MPQNDSVHDFLSSWEFFPLIVYVWGMTAESRDESSERNVSYAAGVCTTKKKSRWVEKILLVEKQNKNNTRKEDIDNKNSKIIVDL